MRVIGGSYRSRALTAPKGSETRPTSDRLRETLFNMLAPRVEGSRFADLYAGTGAVGIEALSRGAAHVWFAENAAPAHAAIRENLNTLGITRKYTLDCRGVGAMLQRLERTGSIIDIVFLDPPYGGMLEYEITLNFLGSSRGCALLSPQALVVAEHSNKTPLSGSYGRLNQTRTRKQGDAALSFFALLNDAT